MKKALILMTLAAVLVSCDRQAARKVFHLTGGTDLEISYEGGNVYFGIEANEDDHWTVSTDADWFSIRQTFGNGDGTKGYDDAVIQVRADRWTRNSTRTGSVTVTGPAGTFKKNISQHPKPVPEKVLQLTGSISCTGAEAEIELPAGYWVKATTDASWLTIVSCEEGSLTVQAEPNPSEDQAREAIVKVYLSDGALLAEVTVRQASEKIPAPID